MNVATYLATGLREAGLHAVFAGPGADHHLLAGAEAAGLRVIALPTPAGAQSAAAGYGRARGGFGVVLAGEVLPGPHPGLPVLVVAPGPALGAGTAGLAGERPVMEVSAPDGLVAVLGQAVQAAAAGGATLVVNHLEAQALDEAALVVSYPSAPNGVIAEAALLLSLSARPVIWAGGGVIQAHAFDQVAEVAGLLSAPVVTSTLGKGAISSDHPMSVGSLAGAREVARLLGNADAALVVGSSLSSRSTRSGALPMAMQMFHVDLDPAVPGRRYPVRAGIAGDARAVLGALAEALHAEASRGRGAVRDPDAQADLVSDVVNAASARLGAGVPIELAIAELRRGIPDHLPTVWDHAPARWGLGLFPTPVPGRFHAGFAGAGPGWSLPAALGVAAGSDTAVVAVLSVEEFCLQSDQLGALSGAGLPVVAVVFDGELADIWQGPPGGDPAQAATSGPARTETANAADRSGAAGLAVEQVRELGGLAGALKHALGHPYPSVLVVGR